MSKIFINNGSLLKCIESAKCVWNDNGILIYRGNTCKLFIANRMVEFLGYNEFKEAFELFLNLNEDQQENLELLIDATF